MNQTTPKRRPPAPPPSRPALSRRHLSKQQRERRLRRLLFTSTAVVLALVLLIPLVGYYREVVTKGQQPVATVNREVITLDTYAKAYALRRNSLERNIQQLQMLSAQSTGGSGGNIFAQQLRQLQSQRETLDQTVLTDVVEERLIVAEAAQRGLTVSTEEEDAQLRQEFGQPPVPTPNPATPAPTVAPDATATPSPAPTVDPIERFRTELASSKLVTEGEYRAMVVRPRLLREKLTAAIAGTTGTVEPQVHARHILLETEDAAKAAKARIDAGEPFEKVAAELSTDTSNKDRGGDLDWFGRGRMTKPFEDAAFALPVGQVSDPVQSQFGWHLIQVTERDENRSLSKEEVANKQQTQFRDWLEKTKDAAFEREAISYDLSPDEITWAKNQFNKSAGLPAGT